MGTFDLFRTSLSEGEVPYSLPNMRMGLDKDGVPKQRAIAHVEVLPDGRLHWKIPDFPENRALIQASYSGRGPAGSSYSVVYPDAVPPQAPPRARTQRDVAQELAAAVAAPAPLLEASTPAKPKRKR